MAKRKSPTESGGELTTEQATGSATADDRKLAGVAIRGITGCGMPECASRLEKMTDATILAIATAERSGKRASVARRIQLGK